MAPQFNNSNPHHEFNLNLLEHGHGKPGSFVEVSVHLHDAEIKDTSSEGRASQENSPQP